MKSVLLASFYKTECSNKLAFNFQKQIPWLHREQNMARTQKNIWRKLNIDLWNLWKN